MRKRQTLIALSVVVLLLVGLGMFIGAVLPRAVGLLTTSRPFNPAVLVQQVQTVSELVTVKYVVEKVVVLEDVKWIAGLGENRVMMVAHGIVKAGIDLSRLQAGDVRISGKQVTIALPRPQIIEAYLDEHQTRVVERTTGLLRVFDKDLEQTARQQAVDDIKRAARNGGILQDANVRAKAQLTALCRQLGFETVEFREK